MQVVDVNGNMFGYDHLEIIGADGRPKNIDSGLTSVGLSMPSAFTVSNSPLTSNGTIGVTGAGTTSQYIDGTGALRAFPGLTGFVPYVGATQNVDLGEFEIKAGQFTLDVSPTGTATVGTTRWNNTIGSSETTLKGGNVILKNGVDLVARVVNKVTPNTTLTKANYPAVRVSGAQGQRLAVAYAQANNDNNSADTIGLVVETIATNQEGFIMTVGQLFDVNTTGSLQGETWADGDVLYLSPTTPGALTNVKPTGLTGHIVVMGYVEYAHAIHGSIYVKVMNGWELDELHNVYINNPLNNQGLFYNASDQLWKNKSIDSALGYTPVPDSRRLTINGTAYDLTADRTWSVGTVTSIATSGPLTGGTITGSGTIGITQSGASSDGYLSSTDWNTFNNKQNAITLTTTGTSGAATLIGSTLNIPQYQSVITNPVTGTGAANYVARWTSSSNIGTGILYDTGSLVGVNTTAPGKTLDVFGDVRFQSANSRIDFTVAYNGLGDLPAGILLSTWATANNNLGIIPSAQGTVGSKVVLGAYNGSVWRSMVEFANTSGEPNLLLAKSAGNVGIGTSSPSYNLDIYGQVAQILSNNSSFTAWYIGNTGTGHAQTYYDAINGDFSGLDYGFVGQNNAGYMEYYIGTLSPNPYHVFSTGNLLLGAANIAAPYGNPKMLIVGGSTPLIASNGNNSGTYLQINTGAANGVVNLQADARTGDYPPLTITTGGSEKMRITSAGSVGIGNSSPGYKLDVAGNFRATNGIVNEANHDNTRFDNILPASVNGSGAGTVQMGWWVSEPGISWNNGGFGYNVTNNGASPYGFGRINTSFGQAYMRFDASGFLYFYNTNTSGTRFETMTLSDAGAIRFNQYGSGTKTGTRAYDLAVDSSGNLIEVPVGAGTVTGSGTANYVARWTSSSNISTGVLYDNGTNVGIGTASPAEKLDVVGNLRLQNSSLGATIYFGSGAGDYLGYYNSDSYYRTVGSHYFEGAGFYKGLWNSIGQLGIGNTNPTQLVDIGISGAQKSLRVRGTYNFDGAYLSSATSNGGAKIEFVAHTGVSTSSAYRIQHDRDQTPDLIFSYAGSAAAYSSLSYSELMRLDPNANLGLGTSAMTVISGYRTFSMDAPSGTFTEYRQNTVNHMRIGADGGRPFIYCESYNPLDIYTGGAFSMRLAANGNLGLGTTNPTAKLHVWNGKIEVTGYPSAGNPFTFLESNYNDQSAVTIRFLNYNPSNGFDSDLGIQLMNTGGSMFDAMIIKGSTGNLGIGTNTPSQKLSVIGNVYANGGFIGYRLDGGIGLEVNGGDLGTGSFIAKFNDYNNTSKVVINGVGDVGIGTTTPTKYMSSTETLMSIVNSNVASLYLYSTTGHLYNMSSISNGDLFWYDVSAGTERMRLTGSGNFGIGISSPAYKLDITASSTSDGFRVNLGGTSKIIANGDGVLAWGASANQGALTWDGSKAIVMGQSGNALSLGANGTWDRLYITTSGNVGIGTTSPQGILAVDGGDFRFNYGNSSSSYYFWLNKSSSADGGILLTRDNSLDWQIVNNTGTGDLGFYSYGSGTQALYIKKSNGNVGINTTNPGVKFEVAGQAFVDKFQYTQGIQISGGDLNDVTTAGFYAGSSLGNAPNAGWFYVTVERHSDAGWVHQLATSYGAGNTENEIYSRTKINGSTWMPWKKIAYSSDVPTATSVYDLLPNARVDFNWVGQVVNGTWVDIFTRANNVLTSGTWMVNMYISDYATGGEHYQYTYSGTFTWFQGGTNQSGTPAASEIALHRMGHAANSTVVYLRTKEETAADGGNGRFQISANYSHFANTTINFKFVKII